MTTNDQDQISKHCKIQKRDKKKEKKLNHHNTSLSV